MLRDHQPSHPIPISGLPWGALPRPLLALCAIIVLLALLLIPALRGPAPETQPQIQPQQHGTPSPTPSPSPTRASARVGSAPEQARQRPLLISADRLRWSPGFGVAEASGTLQIAPLDGRDPEATAELVVGHGIRLSINPQLLIVLLELLDEQGQLALGGVAGGPGDAEIAALALALHEALQIPHDAPIVGLAGQQIALPAPPDWPSAVVLRVLAQRTSSATLEELVGSGDGSFVARFSRRFGDPREERPLLLHDAPLLRHPFPGSVPASARFDHQLPLLQQDGALLGSLSGVGLGYDGHNGWDYAMPAGTPITAAAAGYVLFAGAMDNECSTPAGAVIVEHEGGYRTLYWHLRRVAVVPGARVDSGDLLGESGETGCATGPHLHFGVQRLGRDVDPYGWCGPQPDTWEQHRAGAPSSFLWIDRPNPCPLPEGALIADDTDEATTLLIGAGWFSAEGGNGGGAHVIYASDEQTSARALWRLGGGAGVQHCYAFVPQTASEAGEVRYRIRHVGGESSVTLDQAAVAGGWASLGRYAFTLSQQPQIELRDSDGQPGRAIWADAIACHPES